MDKDMNISYTLYKNKIIVTHLLKKKYRLILHASVT